MRLALALDLGTTSLGAVAIDRNGAVRGRVQRPNRAHLRGLVSGHAEQDPATLFDDALDALRALARCLDGEPASLGLTGQMHGVLLAGPANEPLTPLISWQDRRAGVAGLEAFLAFCSAGDLERAGCRPALGYGGVTLHALASAGKLPQGEWVAATVADWIGAKLADAQPRMDPSQAAALGLFDVVANDWNPNLLAAAGTSREHLPRIATSGAVLGGLTAAAARATGLPQRLPVVASIGDNQAAVLGSLPSGEEAYQINIGTGGQVNWPIPSFERVEAMDTRPLPVGRLMLTGAGVSGGDAYAWVERTVSTWLEAFGVVRSPEAIYDRLAELALALPDDNGVLVARPVFRGSRRRPTERGSFQGVTFENFTPGHVARAVLEGIAAGLYEFVESAGAAAPAAARIIATGNAVRRNPLLVAALERRFGLPVFTPLHREEAAYGAALLAGVSAGIWADLREAGAVMRLRPAGADEPEQARG
ncbi:MAG: FGGY family carbohydrate kinase [Bryobacterales bacterium]